MIRAPLKLLPLLIALGWLHSAAQDRPVRLQIDSPSGTARLDLDLDERGAAGQLTYAGSKLADLSAPLPWACAPARLLGREKSSWHDSWSQVWGDRRKIDIAAGSVVARYALDAGLVGVLEVRLFDDGLGLRFRTESTSPDQPVPGGSYSVDVTPAPGSSLYWPVREHNPVGPVALEEAAKSTERVSIPLLIDNQPGRAWMAFLESDLFSAPLFTTMKIDLARGEGRGIGSKIDFAASTGAFTTPWRVLLFGRNPADLLNSNVCLALAAPCAIADTSWIKPGLSTWDWRVKGYQAGDHVYGNDTASYLRFIRFAQAEGIPYVSFDDNWYDSTTPEGVVPHAKIDIAAAMRAARESGVGVFLYYDRTRGIVPTDALFRQYAGFGAVGVKYGFMDDDPAFTREAIRLAAQHRLLINFHDGPVPMVGVQRTFPNAITREYCHAQQDARRCFTPEEFLRIGIVNALTGPLDQSNGAFGLEGINRGERAKGPLKLQTYNSTVASEVARVLVISTGMACLPDAPEEYLRKPDLLAFLQAIASLQWDESSVRVAEMGHRIVTARRHGDTWFVGAVMDEQGGTFQLPLDFLAPGVRYEATVFADAPDTHYRTNREAYQIRRISLETARSIEIRCAPGGGQAIIFRPVR